MATAFKLLDTPLPSPPRSAVRVVFDAAAQAVDNHVATLPAAVRDATLDELALGDMARATIAIARRDLSAPMFDAFLTWGAEVSLFWTITDEKDPELNRRCRAADVAEHAVLNAASLTPADAALKLYVAGCRADERANGMGPLTFDPAREWKDTDEYALPVPVVADLVHGSDLARSLDDMMTKAWQITTGNMLDEHVGPILTGAFRHAPRSFRTGLTPDFHQLLDKAEEAECLIGEHSRTIYEPAHTNYQALVAAARPEDVEAIKEAALLATGLDKIIENEDRLGNAAMAAVGTVIARPPMTIAEFQQQCRLNDEHEADAEKVLLDHAKALLSFASPAELAWNATMAQWRAAGEAERTYQADVYKPAWDALDIATPAVDLTFTDEAKNGSIGTFRVDPKRPDAWAYNPRLKEKANAILAAHNRRVEAESEPEFAAICEEYDRLGEVTFDRRNDLLDMPAPTHAALLWKLEQLIGNDNRDIDGMGLSWSAKVCDTVIADARRLLAEVAR